MSGILDQFGSPDSQYVEGQSERELEESLNQALSSNKDFAPHVAERRDKVARYEHSLASGLLNYKKQASQGDILSRRAGSEALSSYQDYLSGSRDKESLNAHNERLKQISSLHQERVKLSDSLFGGNYTSIEDYKTDDGKTGFRDSVDYEQMGRDANDPKYDNLFSPRKYDGAGNPLPRDPEELKSLYEEKNAERSLQFRLKQVDASDVDFVPNLKTGEMHPSEKFFYVGSESAEKYLDSAIDEGKIKPEDKARLLKGYDEKFDLAANRLMEKTKKATFARSKEDLLMDTQGGGQEIAAGAQILGEHTPIGGAMRAISPRSLSSEIDVKRAGGASDEEIRDTWGEVTPAYKAGVQVLIEDVGAIESTLGKGLANIESGTTDMIYGAGHLAGAIDRDSLIQEFEGRQASKSLRDITGGSDFAAEVIGVAPSLGMSLGSGAVFQAASRKMFSEGLKKSMKSSLSKNVVGRVLAERGSAITGSAVGGGVESATKTYASMMADGNRSEDEALAAAGRAFFTTAGVTWLLGGTGVEGVFKKGSLSKNLSPADFKAALNSHGDAKKLFNQIAKSGVAGAKDMAMEGVEEFTDEFLQGVMQLHADDKLFVNGEINSGAVGEVLEGAWHAFQVGAVVGGVGGQKSARSKYKEVNDQYTKAFNDQNDAKAFNVEQYTEEMKASLDALSDDPSVSATTEAAKEAIHGRLFESRAAAAEKAAIDIEGANKEDLSLSRARKQLSADQSIAKSEAKALKGMEGSMDTNSDAFKKAQNRVNAANQNVAASIAQLSEAEASVKSIRDAAKAEKKAKSKIKLPSISLPKRSKTASKKSKGDDKISHSTEGRTASTEDIKGGAESGKRIKELKAADGEAVSLFPNDKEQEVEGVIKKVESNKDVKTKLGSLLKTIRNRTLPQYKTGKLFSGSEGDTVPFKKGEAISTIESARDELDTLVASGRLSEDDANVIKTRLDNTEAMVEDMYDHGGAGVRKMISSDGRAAFDEHIAGLEQGKVVKKKVRNVTAPKPKKETKPKAEKKAEPETKQTEDPDRVETTRKGVPQLSVLSGEGFKSPRVVSTPDGDYVKNGDEYVKPEPIVQPEKEAPVEPVETVEAADEEVVDETVEEAPEATEEQIEDTEPEVDVEPEAKPEPEAEKELKETLEEKRKRIEKEIETDILQEETIEARIAPIIEAIKAGKTPEEAFEDPYSMEQMQNRVYDVQQSLAYASSYAAKVRNGDLSTQFTHDGETIELSELEPEQLMELYVKVAKSKIKESGVDIGEFKSLLSYITYQQAVVDVHLNSHEYSLADLDAGLKGQLDSALNDLGRIDKAVSILRDAPPASTNTNHAKKLKMKSAAGLVKLITRDISNVNVRYDSKLDSDAKIEVEDGKTVLVFRDSLFRKVHVRPRTKKARQENAYEALRTLEHEVLHIAAIRSVKDETLIDIGKRALVSPQLMARIREYGVKGSNVAYFDNVFKTDKSGKIIETGKDSKEGYRRLGLEVLALYGQEVRTGTHSSRSISASRELAAAEKGILAPVFATVRKSYIKILRKRQRTAFLDKTKEGEIGVDYKDNEEFEGGVGSTMLNATSVTEANAPTAEEAFAANMQADILSDLDSTVVKELQNIDSFMNVRFGWKPVLAEHINVNLSDGTVAGVSLLGTFNQRANNPLEAPSDEFLNKVQGMSAPVLKTIKQNTAKNASLWENGDKSDPKFLEAARRVNGLMVAWMNNPTRFFEMKGDTAVFTEDGNRWIRLYNKASSDFAEVSGSNLEQAKKSGSAFKKILSKAGSVAEARFKKLFGKELSKGSDFVSPDSGKVIDNERHNLMRAAALLKEANKFVAATVDTRGEMKMAIAKYDPATREFELNYNSDLLPQDDDGEMLRSASGETLPSLSEIESAINTLNDAGYVDATFREWVEARSHMDDSVTLLHQDITESLNDDTLVEAFYDRFIRSTNKIKAAPLNANEKLEALRSKVFSPLFQTESRLSDDEFKRIKSIIDDGLSNSENIKELEKLHEEHVEKNLPKDAGVDSRISIENKRDALVSKLGEASDLRGSFFRGGDVDSINEIVKSLPDFEGKESFLSAYERFESALLEVSELQGLLVGINNDKNYDPDADYRNKDATKQYNLFSDADSEITKGIGVLAPLFSPNELSELLLAGGVSKGRYFITPTIGHAKLAEKSLEYILDQGVDNVPDGEFIYANMKHMIDEVVRRSEDTGGQSRFSRERDDQALSLVGEEDIKQFMSLFAPHSAYLDTGEFLFEGEPFDAEVFEANNPGVDAFKSHEYRAFKAKYIEPIAGKLQADMKSVYDDEHMTPEDRMQLERGDVFYLVLGPEVGVYNEFNARSESDLLRNVAKHTPIGQRENANISDLGRRIPLPVSTFNRDVVIQRKEFNPKFISSLEDLFVGLHESLDEVKEAHAEVGYSYADKLENTPMFSLQEDVLSYSDDLKAFIGKYNITQDHFTEDGLPVYVEGVSQLEIDFNKSKFAEDESFDLGSVLADYDNKILALSGAVQKMNGAINTSVSDLMRYQKPFTLLEKLDNYKSGREVLSGGIENAMKQVERMVPKLVDPNYNLREIKSPTATNKGVDAISNEQRILDIKESPMSEWYDADEFKNKTLEEIEDFVANRKKFAISQVGELSGRKYSAYDVNADVTEDDVYDAPTDEYAGELEETRKQRAAEYMYSFLHLEGDTSFNLGMAVEVLNRNSLTASKVKNEGQLSEEKRAKFSRVYSVDNMFEADPDVLIASLHEVMADYLTHSRHMSNIERMVSIAQLTGTTAIFGANGNATVHSSDSKKQATYSDAFTTLDKYASSLREAGTYRPSDPSMVKVRDGIKNIKNNVFTDEVESEIANSATAYKEVQNLLLDMGIKPQHNLYKIASSFHLFNHAKIIKGLSASANIPRGSVEGFARMIMASNQSYRKGAQYAKNLNSINKSLDNLKKLSNSERSAYGRHLGDSISGGNDFHALMANLVNLPSREVDITTAKDLLKSDILSESGGTSRGLSMLGNLLSKGMSDIPVVIHNGDMAPDDLKAKNTSGVVLDDAGDVIGLFLDSRTTAGFAGQGSGIESIIHDLVEIQVKKNLSTLNDNQKKNLQTLKKNLDNRYSSKARNEYIDKGIVLFDDVMNVAQTDKLEDGSRNVKIEYSGNDVQITFKRLPSLDHPKHPIVDSENYEDEMESFIKEYTEYPTFKMDTHEFTRLLRHQIGLYFDASIEMNAANLNKMVGVDLIKRFREGSETLPHFEMMDNVEFFTKVLFDSNFQVYLGHIEADNLISYLPKALTKDASEDEIKTADMLIQDLSHHMELALLDGVSTEWIKTTEDIEKGAANDNYDNLDTTEKNDKKSDLKGEVMDSAGVATNIVSQLAENLGSNFSILQDLMEIGVSLASPKSSIAAPKFDEVKPTRALPVKGIHSQIKRTKGFSAPLTLDDIHSGRADKIIQFDRMRKGRMGVYSFGVDEDGNVHDNLFMHLIDDEDKRLSFAKGDLDGEYRDDITGDSKAVKIGSPFGRLLDEDYDKADLLLERDLKEGVGGADHALNNITIQIKEIDNALNVKRAEYSDASKRSSDAPNNKKLSSLVVKLEEDLQSLHASKEKLQSDYESFDRDEFNNKLRESYALSIFEERVRNERRRRRSKSTYDPYNSPNIRREQFLNVDPLFNYLRDADNRNIDFVSALEEVLSGDAGFLDGHSFVRRPILDFDHIISVARRSEFGMSPKEAISEDKIDDKNRNTALYQRENHKKARKFTVHSGNDPVGTKSSLLSEFGMEVDEGLASELRYIAVSGLDSKSEVFSKLESKSPVRSSIEGLVSIIADYGASTHASDAEFAKAKEIIAIAEAGDLHGFVHEASYFASKALGTYFMSNVLSKRKFHFSKLRAKGVMHQDAQIKKFLGKDKPVYEMMMGIFGVLDQGLGSRGGRNHAHAKLRDHKKTMDDAIKASGHIEANEAYVATLLTRHTKTHQVSFTNKDGDTETATLNIREQLQNNIDQVRAGLDYSDVESKADKKNLTEFNSGIPALLDKAQSLLDSMIEDELSEDYHNELLKNVSKKGLASVKAMSEIISSMDGDVNALGEALGETKDSYKALNKDVHNYVPHLVVGSSLGGVKDHNETPMYQSLANSVGQLFGHPNSAKALNLNLQSVAMTEINRRLNLTNTAIEYGFVDNLFGYSSNEDKQFVTGMEAGAIEASTDTMIHNVGGQISNFGRELMAKQKVNDTRPAYVRGRLMKFVAWHAKYGFMRSLTSIWQFANQIATGIAGQTFRNNPWENRLMAKNMFKLVFDKDARKDLMAIKRVGGAYFIDRGYNGIEEIQRGTETFNFKDYSKIGGALKMGGIVLGAIPAAITNATVGLADAAALSVVYATQVEIQTGKTIAEIATDPTGYTKELAVARANTESIMAQSDLSKKGDFFQPQEEAHKELARLLFIPFTNQKISMAADTYAFARILASPHASLRAKHEAAKGVTSNIAQQVVYHGIKAPAALYGVSYIAAMLAADDEDETKAEKRKRIQEMLIKRLSGQEGMFNRFSLDKVDTDSMSYEERAAYKEKERELDVNRANEWYNFKLPIMLQMMSKHDKAYSDSDYVGKLAHGVVLDASTLIHPYLSLDPSTNTLAVVQQYASDAFADKYDLGEEKSYGNTMNPRGRRDTDYFATKAEAPDGRIGLHRQNIGMAWLKNVLGGSESVHGLIPSVAWLAYRNASATQDYQMDYANIAAYASQFGGTREARRNLEQEMNMRLFGSRYVPSSVKSGEAFLAEDRGVAWHNSKARPEKPAIGLSAPFDSTPAGVFKTSESVFGEGRGYTKDRVKFKYNPLVDGDSFAFVSSKAIVPLTYEKYRIVGGDSFEKTYDNKYGYSRHYDHYEETGIPEYTAMQLGKEATWHVDQLLHGKNVTIYHQNRRSTGERLDSFAMVEVEGKQVDLGLYLASKGLAMLRPASYKRIPQVLPSGRSKDDYIKAFRAAESYARQNKFGMFKYGDREKLLEQRKKLYRLKGAIVDDL